MAATNKRGVFSLETVLERQTDNTWSNIFDPFRYIMDVTNSVGTNFGYYGGGCGNGSNQRSWVDRIDFDNDTGTSSPRGNLSHEYEAGGGSSSTSHGYFAGGVPDRTHVDRIDYANDSATASPKGPLTLGRSYAIGNHNSSYGYHAGGYAPSVSTGVTIVDRIDFAADTATASPKGPLDALVSSHSGVSNQSYGYWAAGYSHSLGSRVSIVRRIDYSNDTSTTSTKGPVTVERSTVAATGNADYGYIGTGYTPGGASSVMDRIDYSNDTNTALARGPYFKSSNAWWLGATGNQSYGYWSGDEQNYSGSQIGRLDYANDTTTAAIRGALSRYRQRHAGVSSRASANPGPTTTGGHQATRSEPQYNWNGTNHGYFTGGESPSIKSTTNRIDFDNDTATAVSKGPLTEARFSINAFAGSNSAGHMAGGYNGGSPGRTSLHDRVDYSNDTTTMDAKANLTFSTYGVAATGNTDKGYWWGGRNDAYSPNYLTFVDRINYANSTVTEMPRSTTQGNGRAAAGNANFGWWSGAQQTLDPGYMKTWVYRLDYGNDTAAPTPKGPILSQGHGHSASGNSNYGWHVGGSDGVPSRFTYISRIDYANDTVTASSRSNTSTVQRDGGSTGNSSYGYFTAGYGGFTIMSRIDYSNDTTTPLIRNIMPGAQIFEAGASPAENGFANPPSNTVDKGSDGFATTTTTTTQSGPAFGYLASGYSGPSAVTTVDRVDYTNDSETTLTKGPLSQVRTWGAGAGNTSYGYAGGGNPDGTNVDRVDYSNDSPTTSPKGNLTQARYYLSATGNANYGWWGGGAVGGGEGSTIDRKDYSSDTTTNSVRGALSVAKRIFSSATGNSDYGYFGGGATGNGGPYVSTVERVDYSNDSPTASPKGPLNAARGYAAATGNASYGYWGGASPASSPDLSSIERIDFSNDTATGILKSLFPSNRGYFGATGNVNHAYWMGGSPNTSSINRLDLSNDTTAATQRGNLSSIRNSQAGVFSAQAYGLAATTTSTTTYTPRVRWVDSAPEGTPGPAFGYFYGSQPQASAIDRVDFSNDTSLTHTGNSTSPVVFATAGTSSKDYGYFTGGWSGSAESKIDRTDYSNDSATATPKGNLSVERRYHMAVGNLSAGYYVGGYSPSYTGRTSIEKIDYSNDTGTSSPGAKSTLFSSGSAGAGNQSYGYYAGGFTQSSSPNGSTYIERIDYSSDTSNGVAKGNLSASKYYLAGASNSNYAWYAGGNIGGGGGSNRISNVERIDFSNDTATGTPKGNLNAARDTLGGTGSSSYGYFGGNNEPANGSSTDRIDYSNDTATATPKGNFSVSHRKAVAAVSSQENANSTIPAPVQRPFPVPTTSPIPVSNPYGYVMGGEGNGNNGPANNPSQRIDFSNDTATALVKAIHPLSPSINRHYYSSATSNRDFAYSCQAGVKTYIYRLDYSNDSADLLIKGHRFTGFTNATSNYGGYDEAATGNLNYGYWNGGYKNYSSPVDPSVCPAGHIQAYSHIDRIDYSNDTANALRRSYTSLKRGQGGAAGTNVYGYWIGSGINQCPGSTAGSVVERTDYANDGTNALVRGPITTSTYGNRSIGNANYAWNTGGSGISTKVDRIDYSSDTSTASPKGNLSVGRLYHQATGNQSYGYIAGTMDYSVSYKSMVESIDYSNDTATGTPKGPLTYATAHGGGTSATLNNNGGFFPNPGLSGYEPSTPSPGPNVGPAYGYFAGGSTISTVDRIDYSNDSSNCVTKGSLTRTTARQSAGAGNRDYGYIGGGGNPNGYSRVDRIDYASDTDTAVSKGPLATSRFGLGSSGNASYGYWSAGRSDSSTLHSTVDRIDYSNDTATALARGSLTSDRRDVVSVGNLNYSYVGSGRNASTTIDLVDRIDFSNDTATAAPKGPLPADKDDLGATGNINFGYFGGGDPASAGGSYIERIDYSNDTVNASRRGVLSASRRYLTATGNASYGYFAGGESSGTSIVDRIDYGNDTVTGIAKGPLSGTTNRFGMAAVSAQENGLAGLTSQNQQFFNKHAILSKTFIFL